MMGYHGIASAPGQIWLPSALARGIVELTRRAKKRMGDGRGDLSGRLAGHVKQPAKEVVVREIGPSVPVQS
jgi:hypothetical protein